MRRRDSEIGGKGRERRERPCGTTVTHASITSFFFIYYYILLHAIISMISMIFYQIVDIPYLFVL